MSALNYCGGIFFKTVSYLYEVVRTNVSADFWTFNNFDGNFAKIVAPPGEINKNHVVHLTEQSRLKKAENRIKIDPQTVTQYLFELCPPCTGRPSVTYKNTPIFAPTAWRA